MNINKQFYLRSLLFVIVGLPVFSAGVQKDIRAIKVPVAGVYVKPNHQSCYNTQQIYGHEVEVIKIINNEWVKAQLDDKAVGYMQVDDLVMYKHLSHASFNSHRIKSLQGSVYPESHVFDQTIMRLPYNAYIKVKQFSSDAKWAQIELLNGSYGWIMTGDIEPLYYLTVAEMIKRVPMFLGITYIWGGASSCGYDCSGFAQTIARQLGYPMLRNSRAQAEDPHLINVLYEDIQPGDFVYFGKSCINHVGFCIASGTIIHAAIMGNEPKVVITPINHPPLVFKCARRLPRVDSKSFISEIIN